MKRRKRRFSKIFMTIAVLLCLLFLIAVVFRLTHRSDGIIPDLRFETEEDILFDPDAI